MRKLKRVGKQFWRAWMPNGWEPVDTGWILTIAIVLLVEVLALSPAKDGILRIEDFLDQGPNEMGDTLAGIFSALAFVWIIVTVFLQSHELSEQRKELKFTRCEIKDQRKATQDMATAMKAQAEIFLEEQKQREEQRAAKILTEVLGDLKELMIEGFEIRWSYVFSGNGFAGTNTTRLFNKNISPDEMDLDSFIRRQTYELVDVRKKLLTSLKDPNFTAKQPSAILLKVGTLLADIDGLHERLGEDQKRRLAKLGIESLAKNVAALRSLSVWDDEFEEV